MVKYGGGEFYDKPVINVPQHAFCSINDLPCNQDFTFIGTNNLIQCVMIILHNPENNYASLAHIDYATSKSSVKQFIEASKSLNNNDKLHAYVAGGRLYGSPFLSKRNTKLVREVLQDSNVKIMQWDVGKKGSGVDNYVFNRLTGSLYDNPFRPAHTLDTLTSPADTSLINDTPADTKTASQRAKEYYCEDKNVEPPVKKKHIFQEKIKEKWRDLTNKEYKYDKANKYYNAYWVSRPKEDLELCSSVEKYPFEKERVSV